eukprot:SAG11_NODE_5086_length_1668_cov_1.866157_2_plen_117_part_01
MRWGSKTCPEVDDTLYTGYASGAKYSETGSGSRNLCLPPFPDGVSGSLENDGGGSLWAIEYDTAAYARTAFSFIADQDRYEMPCAVCLRNHVASFIEWGSTACPVDSLKEYGGYMMT